jgi:GWxTD domain-containing protein
VILPARRASLVLAGALAVAALCPPPGARAAPDRPALRSLHPPFYSVDLAVTVDSASRARVRVTISVPYSELNWQRDGDGYVAGAAFVVELTPARNRRRLYGDSWEQRLRVADYHGTVARRNVVLATREFELPPDQYAVRATVQDVTGREVAEVRDRLEVRDLSRVPVGFADLELGVMDSAGVFGSQPSRSFGLESEALAVRAVLVDRRPGPWPRAYHYLWRVQDESGTVASQGDTTVNVGRPAEPVLLRPSGRELFIGAYAFELELREGKTSWRTSRSFEVEESGPPVGRAFDEMLEALSYIAESNEVDAMRGQPREQQVERWEAFWRRRDPTPETVRNEYQIEFFRRMRYADRHFLGFGPGWRSDMGRIYIRYGPPDQIEQRQATASQPGLEIWYYNQPYRRLVFSDREGFGRFTLLNPPPE